jgi:hypothetical protein
MIEKTETKKPKREVSAEAKKAGNKVFDEFQKLGGEALGILFAGLARATNPGPPEDKQK